MKRIIMLAMIAVAGVTSAVAQTERKPNQNTKVVISDKDGWHKIGETYVDFKRDRDEVIVTGADRFATLQFRVTDSPIHLLSLEVFYEDGTMKEIPVKMDVAAGAVSNNFDLKGSESNLKKVVYVYHTVGDKHNGKPAHVELWGMKTNTDKK